MGFCFFRCDPFVLYYTKLELVMNFSLYGNDARFIRRSCSPTAEVGPFEYRCFLTSGEASPTIWSCYANKQ